MKKIKGIFCFKVKKGSDVGVWVVDVKNGKGSVKFDPSGMRFVTEEVDLTYQSLVSLFYCIGRFTV